MESIVSEDREQRISSDMGHLHKTPFGSSKKNIDFSNGEHPR